jgi:hypothetical protein
MVFVRFWAAWGWSASPGPVFYHITISLNLIRVGLEGAHLRQRRRNRIRRRPHVSLLRYVQFPVQSAKFPVSILREFGGTRFEFVCQSEDWIAITSLKAAKFPCIFPRNRELRDGDGFADDCFHRQLVGCFSREILLSEIIAEVPQVSLAKVLQATTES